MGKRPVLQIIEGGSIGTPEWLDFRSNVLARSPFEHAKLTQFRVSRNRLELAGQAKLRQPILDAWTAIFGRIPPVPNFQSWARNVSPTDLPGIAGSHACFRGLKRPLSDDDRAWNSFAYVSKPKLRFVYRPHMACVIEPRCVPSDLVCVVYVRLDLPFEIVGRNSENAKLSGVVTHCEFVEADSQNPLLPTESNRRYRKRMW